MYLKLTIKSTDNGFVTVFPCECPNMLQCLFSYYWFNTKNLFIIFKIFRIK